MSDVIIYQGAAIPFSFSRQNGQPLDVTSVMRTLADITTYAANTEKKYVPYEGQTIACLEDKMLYILELKNGVLVPKLSGGVKLIKRDDNVELTDDAALSALRSVKEIEERAISRTKRDTAAEVIEFAKGLTAGSGKTTVSGDGKITTLNLLIQALAEMYDLNVSHVATMMRTIIKDYVSSEAFTPGLTGEGFKISKALNGDWNLEIDNVVVRKVMTIFEMVISKVRSINGGLVISDGNGRIKSVAETTGSPAYYVIGIEGDMQFVVDDYVRCQVFSNGHAKFYCVRVSSISNNSILVLKSEFTNGAVPAIGDDLVQMGNATNKARQGIIYLTASEDGKPRISVMDGVNSTSLVGKNKVILGCLDGITDTDFPTAFQPSGYGLYAMNVFLKGIFVLRNGKSVESEFETVRHTLITLSQEFSVAMGEFTSKITEVKEYTDGKVDGVIIGSRNLFKGSNDFPLTATDTGVNASYKNETIDGQLIGTVTRIANGNNCYYYGWYASRMSTRPLENKTYVWSIDVCSNCPGRVYFDLTSPYSNMFTTNFNSTDGKWIRISGVIRVNLVPSDLNWRLLLVGVNGSLVGDYVSYKNPMVTEGTKTSSNWTPAPEDVTADAQAKANAAQAAAEAVAIAKATLAKTEASAYADGIVTAEEQRAIADAQAKLAEAKRDAAAKADEAKQAAISDAASKYPTKSEFSTSITQLSNSISLKANQTEVTGLDTRLSSAETKITPDAINLTVQSQVNAAAQEAIEKATKLSSYNVGVYNPQGSAGIFLFKTKILSRSSQMLVVDIDGYMYGDSNPFGVSLVFYTFPSGLTSYGYTVNGVDIVDRIRLAENAGFLAIELRLKTDVYFPGFSIKISSTRAFIPISYSENWEFNHEYLSHGDLFDGNYSDVCIVPKKDTYAESYTKAQVQILSDQISLKVSNDTFNALGQRVSDAESTLSVQATQIASKVSQSDFNALGQRVGSAESAILQQADQISLKASKSDLNTLSGRVSSTEAELRVHATEIGLKVTAGDVSAGMTITPNKITMFGKVFDLTGKITFSSMASDAQGKITAAQSSADKAITDAANSLVTSRNNIAAQLGYGNYDAMSAAAIAGKTIINGGKIRTELIDATAIVTGSLVASVISATNITTGRLTVTDGAKIGGMVIENNVLKGGSISLSDGAKIGDLYIVGGAFSSLDTNIVPPGTSWFSMSKDFLAYNYYNRYDYSMSSCRVSGDGIAIDKGLVTINNGGLTIKRPTGIALDIQGSIITRDSSGNMNTGKTFNIALFDAWVGGQGKQVELTITNGIITGWRFF